MVKLYHMKIENMKMIEGISFMSNYKRQWHRKYVGDNILGKMAKISRS